MIIKELKISNFKSHKETGIVFGEGITVITGKNGAGKSTILEAVQYALFKKNGKNAIRQGSDRMTVQLSFVENGETYKVKRSKTNARTASSIHRICPDGSWELLAEGNRETDIAVQGIIGIDPELFLNAVYIRQGEISEIVTKSPGERKKVISRLLKIDSIEKAWSNMVPVVKGYEVREAQLSGEMAEYGSVFSEIRENEKTVSTYENELHVLAKEKARLEKSVMDDSHRIDEWKSAAEEKSKNDKALDELGKKLFHWEGECLSLKGKLDKRLEKRNMMYTLKEENIEEMLDMLNGERKALENELNLIRHKNNSLEKSLKGILSVDGKCPVCMSDIEPQRKSQLEKGYKAEIKENMAKADNIKGLLNENGDKTEKALKKLNLIRQLEVETADTQNIETQLSKAMKEKTETEKKIMELKKETVDIDSNEYNKTVERHNRNTRNLKKAIERTGMLKGSIKQTIKANEKLKAKAGQMEATKKELEQVREYLSLLNTIRETYSKNGIQAQIRNIAKPMIQQNTKNHFERFNFEYHDMALTDDYDITVSTMEGETNVSMLSGGEQIAAALSLRLGITETLTDRNIGCIILDEPTIHLDNERIHELSTLLCKMGTVPQSIIVTHDETLESIADTTIKVRKEKGESKVTEGT